MICYRYKTRIGYFWIVPSQTRWHAVFGDEILGPYEDLEGAAGDLNMGATDSLSCGVDTSSLDIPYDLSEWEILKYPFRQS